MSAIQGFLECIKLREKTLFDDLIQMVSLFFRVKIDEKSFDEISKRIQLLNDQQFLLVIPQLFAKFERPKIFSIFVRYKDFDEAPARPLPRHLAQPTF